MKKTHAAIKNLFGNEFIRAAMIESILKVISNSSNKEEILEILYSVKGPTEASPECLNSSVFNDSENESIIYYQEVWQDKAALSEHIRSDIYKNIFAVMDMSDGPPEIKFNTVSHTAGMDFIAETLGISKDE